MEIKIRNYQPQFLQEGGQLEGANETPVEAQPVEQDPMAQLLQVAAQALQNQDCQAAMAVCQALMQLAQGGAEQAPVDQAPVYKKGGKLSRWIKQ